MAVLLAAIVLPVAIARSVHESAVENSNIDWGSLPTIDHLDEGEVILADCARTACVAIKAADLAAQTEAASRAKEANSE